MEKTNRNWLLAYVLGFISGIAGLVSCSHLAHTLRTRPDGNERTLPAASRKLPETPPVRLEVIREASLPSSALNIAPAPPALYVSLAFEGLAVFSMDDPTSPKTIEIQPGMVDPKDPGARVVLRVLPDPAHKRLLALDRVQGLTIYDATDPLHPRPRWSKGMPEGVNARPIGIVEIGKYYYLSCGGGGLRVLPKNFDPETGSTMALNIFDHTRESVFYPPHYLLVADGYDTGLQVLDIRKPASPRLVHIFHNSAYCDQIVPVGNYVFTANRQLGFGVVDMSSPAHPYLANFIYNPSGDVVVKSLALWKKNHLLVGYQKGTEGGYLEIFDVSNPVTPILEARERVNAEVNTMTLMDDLLFVGLWKKNKIRIYRLSETPG